MEDCPQMQAKPFLMSVQNWMTAVLAELLLYNIAVIGDT